MTAIKDHLRTAFYGVSRYGSPDDQFEGIFAQNVEAGRIAISVGDGEHVLTKQWSESLVDSFLGFQYPVEDDNDLMRNFLTDARETWIGQIEWDRMRWYLRNKAMEGTYSSLAAMEVRQSSRGYSCHGFTSGYRAVFREHGGEIHQTDSGGRRDKEQPFFWSGYSPPLPGGYRWDLNPSSFFDLHATPGTTLLMVSPSISEWILGDPDTRISALIGAYDPSVMLRNRMRSGEIRNRDSLVSIIRL